MQFSTLLGVAAFLVLANAIPTPTDDSYDALASLANSNPDELSNDPGLSQDLGDAEIYYDGNNPNKQRDMQPDIRPRYSCDDCWNCDALQDCIHYDDDGDDDECDKSASCYRFCLSCSDNDKRGVTKFQATPYHILPRNDSSNSDVNHVDVTFIGASGTNNFSIPATVDGNPTNVYGAQVPCKSYMHFLSLCASITSSLF